MCYLPQTFGEFLKYIKVIAAIVAKIIIGLIVTTSEAIWWLTKGAVNKVTSIMQNVGDESGILALKLIFNKNLHMIERLFWLFNFVAAIYGAVFITRLQITRYIKSPTVMSVDRNYRGWEGYMPSITLCYYDRLHPLKANDFILQNWNISVADEDYFYYMDFLYALANATINNYVGLANFADDERFENINLLEVVRATEKSFEQIISTYESNFEIPVDLVMTEKGSCYAINSAVSAILGQKINTQNFGDLKDPLKCKFGKLKCYMKIDFLESVAAVEVNSPFELSSAGASVIEMQKSNYFTASYKILETVASSNLRNLRVEQRKCRFSDEETTELKIYTKSLCLAKCRAKTAMEMCDCVPFFYTFADEPPCDPNGFRCLLEFKWPVWGSDVCKCSSGCTEMEYDLQTLKKNTVGANNLEDVGDSDGVSSSFHLELIPPKVRHRRDVVFSFEDLLVSFAGTFGLFLGVSVITFFFLIYAIIESISKDIYFLIRLILKGICHMKRMCIRLCRLRKGTVRDLNDAKVPRIIPIQK